jgi:hypothetical protein
VTTPTDHDVAELGKLEASVGGRHTRGIAEPVGAVGKKRRNDPWAFITVPVTVVGQRIRHCSE